MVRRVEELGWVDSLDGTVLGIVQANVGVEAIFRRLGSRVHQLGPLDFNAAMDAYLPGSARATVVQIGTCPAGDVIIEPNGWLVSSHTRQLSGSGQAISVFWQDAKGLAEATVARDGEVVRWFTAGPYRDTHGEALPEESGLPWDDWTMHKRCLTIFFERLAGVEVSSEWLLRTPRTAFAVSQPPTPNVLKAWPFMVIDADVNGPLQKLDTPDFAAFLRWLAPVIIRVGGLDDPDVDAAIAQLAAGHLSDEDGLASTMRAYDRINQEVERLRPGAEQDRAVRQRSALIVFGRAFSPDNHGSACEMAVHAAGDRWPDLRASILGYLGYPSECPDPAADVQ